LPDTPENPTSDFASDLLEGADEIARFLYGDSPTGKRQVYRLSTEVAPEYRLPTFKLGGNTLCARKSAILRWIERQELARQAAP